MADPKGELEKRATYKGSMVTKQWVSPLDEYPCRMHFLNKDLVHYFDKNFMELGYMSSLSQTPTIFPNRRKWDKTFLGELIIKKL